MRPVFAAAFVPLLLAGCAMQKVTIAPERLSAVSQVKLACDYRLGSLVDARPAGGSSGSYGLKAFVIEDTLGLVRGQLEASGLREGGAGRPVDIRLMQFYLATNTVTKVPVVVYEASIDGRTPSIIRGQPSSVNNWGSENEGVAAYQRALREANSRLFATLNASCGQVASGDARG